MQITAITYTSADEDAVDIDTADAGRLRAPWPIHSWHREIVERWLAEGNAIAPHVEPPEPVPDQVSRLQLVRELRERPYGPPENGGSMWDAFKAMLAQNPAATEDWELANYIERHHPMTPQIGLAFSLDEAGLDQLFRDAAAR
jgi:hypothetical protein